MVDKGPLLEQDPAGRPEVPEAFQDAFKLKQIKPTTGLPEGQVGPIFKPEGFISKVRRALSKLAENQI